MLVYVTYLLLLLQIFVHGRKVEIRECDDCMRYTSCEGARVLASTQRSTDHAVLFKNSLCGLKYYGEEEKVCCSDFPNPKLALLPSSCKAIDSENTSTGREVALYEFPWMTLIAQEKFKSVDFTCTGTIINSLYILTAAHCVDKNKIIKSVRVGEHDIRKNTDCQGLPPNVICESHIQNIDVAEIIIHEHYYAPSHYLHIALHDIALLRLVKHIDFSYANVAPICLPITRELLNVSLDGSYGVVAGWGQTETGYSSPIMLKVEVPVHSDSECLKTLQSYGDILPTEKLTKICAGEFGKDSCQGDSGGPLFIEQVHNNIYSYVQYGIVSQGSKRCGSGMPGIYTDVRRYMDWILENIKM